MLRLPSKALARTVQPSGMLRLPSRALVCTTQPSGDAGRSPVCSFSGSPPSSPSKSLTEESTSSLMDSTGSTRSSFQLRRSCFFLEHSSSAAVHDVYDVDKHVLGSGGFGTVHRATLKGAANEVRAVKVLKRKQAKAEATFKKEVSILRQFDHPCICRFFETFQDDRCMYMVLEYIKGIELFDYIQDRIVRGIEPSECEIAQIMQQVSCALLYCHERKVVHRDLKPENIMVQTLPADNEQNLFVVKLIDFGLAMDFTSPAGESLTAGTYDYMAPEVQRGHPATPASDMWSFGIVMHALLAGGLPLAPVRQGRKRIDTRRSLYSDLSRNALCIMEGLLQIDPERRLTAKSLMQTAWMRGNVHKPTKQDSRNLGKTMSAFLEFHQSLMLRRAVLTALAMQATSHQVEELRQQFIQVDADGNGRITRAELAASLSSSKFRTQSGEDVSSWVESIFDSIDTDGSDEIEYTEWLAAAMVEGGYRSEQAVQAAFRVFDIDHSGKVSQQELARVLAREEQDIAHLIPQFDTDGDGELDLEEFTQLLHYSPESAVLPGCVTTHEVSQIVSL